MLVYCTKRKSPGRKPTMREFPTPLYAALYTLHQRRTLCRISLEQYNPSPSPFMSHAYPTASSSSNQVSNFEVIINNALDKYKKRTKKNVLEHPLITELEACNTPSAILSLLQQRVQSQRRDDRWTRWLDATVNVVYSLSGTLGQGVGMVRFRKSDCLRSVLSYSSVRYSHQHK